MKSYLIILFLLEVIFVCMAVSPNPIFIGSSLKNAVRAMAEWQKNPTPENEANWLREKARMDHKYRAMRFCIFSLLELNTLGIIILILRLKKGRAFQN
jgi:hypothetical protein